MDTSTWLNDIKLPSARPSLDNDIEAEVATIGGGLTGTLSAYLLAKEGKKVVVLEKKDISNTTTAYTTAWLNCVVDTDLSDLVKMYGEDAAKGVWRSGMEAIDLIEKIIQGEKIDCNFSRVSHFRYAANEKEMKNLRVEHGFAQKFGFETILHDKSALNFTNTGSLEIKSQAKFHPIKFLMGLRKASEKYGVVYYENTEAKEITDLGIVVTTKIKTVRAKYSIIATHQPFNNPKEFFAHKATYTSYVLEVSIPHGIIPEGLYEDEKNPYHYFRIDAFPENDRLILGGEDHRAEISKKILPPEKSYNALLSFLDKLLPNIRYKVITKWDGGIIETIDGLPYIGSYSKTNKNTLVATGFSGNGMTYSAVAAQIFKDIIFKKENPYIQLYNAGRKTKPYNLIKKAMDFIGEFFGGAVKNIFK